MNIFFLDLNQRKCAKWHADKHVIKMILESVILLCSAHHIFPNKNLYKPPYKLTHKNHPCSKWVRESLSNYKWLIKLTKELCFEYTYRYEKIHKCESYIFELENNVPDIPDIGFTTPAQAMKDEYKSPDNDIENIIEAYKNYYYFEKYNIHSWKKRPIPEFIKEFNDIE